MPWAILSSRFAASPTYRALALAAALVTRVERMGLTLFHDIDLFHGAREGANGYPVKFEAVDFSVRINSV
jgi:hypothetical protein